MLYGKIPIITQLLNKRASSPSHIRNFVLYTSTLRYAIFLYCIFFMILDHCVPKVCVGFIMSSHLDAVQTLSI